MHEIVGAMHGDLWVLAVSMHPIGKSVIVG
jgi:hypothetical protein